MISITTTVTRAAATQRRISAWRERLPKAISQQTKRQALRLKTIMVRGIRDGAPGGKEFAPLADTTIKMKKSSKPLIDNGDLIRSIDVDDVGSDQFFIGVNRNAESDDGEKLANLAQIHNDGTPPYSIPVTPAMRRFWFVMVAKKIFSAPLSPHTDFILHPGQKARPFLEPSYEEWSKDAERQFKEGLARALGVRGMF